MPVRYYAIMVAAALLALSLFFIPQQDCSVFYGEIREKHGCQSLVWPKYILDKIT